MSKNHIAEIRVLIGYSEVRYPLSSEQEIELQQARHVLEQTHPKELVDSFLAYSLGNLGPKRPK